MSFTSLEFLIFFPLITLLYFLLPHRLRWILLLLASYYFYMCWKAEYLLLIIASTLIDYFCGLKMAEYPYDRKDEDIVRAKRRKYLIISLCSNLGLLFAFKYFNFFNDSLRAIFDSLNIFYGVPAFEVLLPVGISFYTFQTLSYTIDLYRGNKDPEKHLGVFALYVAFFPQLVAGPIERSTHLMPQFWKKIDFDAQRISSGFRLMLWGFAKKIIVANYLALYVNAVYNNVGEHNTLQFIIATYFFAFQIYCDFSAYSDIAIGAARVLGFNLMKNFDTPYFSKSVSEFWRRWHISLSTWFRDYVYIPLGGSRVTKSRWYLNIFAVFLVSGLWHGANWTFVIWGALHGAYIVIESLTKELRAKLYNISALSRFSLVLNAIKMFICFQLVNFAWIFFRANSSQDLWQILETIQSETMSFLISAFTGTIIDGPLNLLSDAYKTIRIKVDNFDLITALIILALLLSLESLNRKYDLSAWLAKQAKCFRWLVYCIVIVTILLFTNSGSQEFIYFQF